MQAGWEGLIRFGGGVLVWSIKACVVGLLVTGWSASSVKDFAGFERESESGGFDFFCPPPFKAGVSTTVRNFTFTRLGAANLKGT
jgi:hypothetical protein